MAGKRREKSKPTKRLPVDLKSGAMRNRGLALPVRPSEPGETQDDSERKGAVQNRNELVLAALFEPIYPRAADSQWPKELVASLEKAYKNEAQIQQWRRTIQSLLADLPLDFVDMSWTATALGHCFKNELAAKLQSPLNTHLRALPRATYAEKQSIASTVNGYLRDYGLAIRCPKTNKPAILIADVEGGPDSPSRFRFEVRAESGRRIRTVSSRELPELVLMEDTIRPEPFSKGRTRSG
jgi:hypothetical protein